MASFFSRLGSLFSGGGASGKVGEEDMREYEGLRLFAVPQKDGATYRVAGRIEKDIDGKTLVRNFIRADVINDFDEAKEFTFRKARQIVEQNGAALFSDGEPTRQV